MAHSMQQGCSRHWSCQQQRVNAPWQPHTGWQCLRAQRMSCRVQASQQQQQQQSRQAGREPPRDPPSVQQEALNSLQGQRPGDDGHVEQGDTETGRRGKGGRFYLAITGFPFPLGPLFARQTCRYEAVPGQIWCFEQEQALAFINVATNVRMTCVKLKTGGLLMYSPIAPTRECMDLLKELNAPVEHIILSTHAYEHKQFVSPMQRRWPGAKVWKVPRLWSLPINLPLPLLGIFNSTELEEGASNTPWADELDCKLLSEYIGAAPYCEAILFHKASGTVICTDLMVYIPSKPPEIINRDKLQRAGSDNLLVKTVFGGEKAQHPRNLEEQEALGWQRMSLLISYFKPGALREPRGFPALGDKLIASPVTQVLVFAKIPGPIRRLVDGMCRDWDIRSVISGHFKSPVDATKEDVRRAFTFAYELAEEGTDFKAQEARAARQGGKGPAHDRRLIKTGPDSTFDPADFAGLQFLDWFFRLTGVALKQPDNT